MLKYPKLLPYDTTYKSIQNIFCYVIRHYGTTGLSVLIYRQPKNDQVVVICGDWVGNNLDLSISSPLVEQANQFLKDSFQKCLSIMKLIKVDQVQLFFAITNGQLILVDIQPAFNKLCGPGMVRDIFGKILPTQEVLKIEVLDERAIECIKDGSGSYAGDLIIKPSKFKLYHESNNNTFTPMYVEVVR